MLSLSNSTAENVPRAVSSDVKWIHA